MRSGFIFVPGLVLITALFACVAKPDFSSSNRDCRRSSYSGFFILNEGTFGNNDARLDFVQKGSDSVTCSGIFSNLNGMMLGDVAQEGHFFQESLYIVVNNSHLIHELRADGLTLNRTLFLPSPERSSPRALAFPSPTKMYLTSLLDTGLYVIDREQFRVRKKIKLNNHAEGIALTGRHAFVSLGNYVGETRAEVAVIHTQTDSLVLIRSLPLANPGPVFLAQDRIWVACRGDFFATEARAGLVAIDTSTFEVVATLPVSGNLQNELVTDRGIAYVLRDSSIAKITLPNGPVESDWVSREAMTRDRFVYPYSLSLDRENGLLYAGLAHGLGANGAIVVLDPFGRQIRRYPAGRFPGQVIFRP